MLAAFGASVGLALTGSRFFLVVFWIQAAAYLHALLSEVFPGLAAGALGRVVHYFVIVNASILVAWVRYLGGERVVTWKPSAR